MHIHLRNRDGETKTVKASRQEFKTALERFSRLKGDWIVAFQPGHIEFYSKDNKASAVFRMNHGYTKAWEPVSESPTLAMIIRKFDPVEETNNAH